MRSMKTYASLDEFPIYNYMKLQHEDDLRYLYKLDSYAMLPKVSVRQKLTLARTYAKMMEDADLKESIVTRAKRDVVFAVNKIAVEVIETSKDIEKIDQALTLLRGLMIDTEPKTEWLNLSWRETPRQRQLCSIAEVKIRRYLELKKMMQDAGDYDLFEEVAAIETMLGVSINVHRCPVKQYFAYQKAAKKRTDGKR